MSADIVERLEELAWLASRSDGTAAVTFDSLREAAAEIGRLRGEVALAAGWHDEAIAPAEAKGDAQPAGGEAVACPFCGSVNVSDGEILSARDDGTTWTQSACLDCGALGPEAETDGPDYGDARAIAAWNRRTTPPTAQVQQEAVDLSNWAAHYSINPAAVEALRSIIRPPAPVQAAHPSACELGAVRELPAKWRTPAKRAGNEWAAAQARQQCAYELEAALQHRGDRQEVDRG